MSINICQIINTEDDRINCLDIFIISSCFYLAKEPADCTLVLPAARKTEPRIALADLGTCKHFIGIRPEMTLLTSVGL